MSLLGGSSGDDPKRASRDLREALEEATGATAFVGAVLGIVAGTAGPLIAPGFALATAVAYVLGKRLKRIERDPPLMDYELPVQLQSNRVDPFRVPGGIQPLLAALIVAMDSTSAHLDAVMTAIERADGARGDGKRLVADAREGEARAFARRATRPLHGLAVTASLYRVEATQWELSLSEQDASAIRDRVDEKTSLANALRQVERRWPQGPEYEDDPEPLSSVLAAGAQREALGTPLRLVPRGENGRPWGQVPDHATALAAALQRWAVAGRPQERQSGSREKRQSGSRRQQKLGESE